MKRIIAAHITSSQAQFARQIGILWCDRHSPTIRCLIQLYINEMRRMKRDERSQFIFYKDSTSLFTGKRDSIKRYKQAA